MPTPYEEISNNYSRREAVKPDCNLSLDSLMLGGIPAEDYATKEYVKKVDEVNSIRDQRYTDGEIEKLRENLKGYTDNSIGNIDFEPFARKTDLEAVANNMKEHCETSCANTLASAKSHCETSCDSTRSFAQEKFNSLNSKCDSLSNSMKGKYDELFQSVSNGKSKIAGAITDKGVVTSASDSFDTMAYNIRRIVSGSGEGGGGGSTVVVGTDTSDATASASDIRLGKTAYVKGNKITGTLIPTTTTSPGGIIVNTSEIEELYKYTGTDFSNISTSRLNNSMNTTISSVEASGMFVSSSDSYLSFMARAVRESSGVKYVYVNKVDKASFEYVNGEVLKYSYAELGLNPNAVIKGICFGGTGYDDRGYVCLLGIFAEYDSVLTLHFYPFDLANHGRIGRYSNEMEFVHFSKVLPSKGVECFTNAKLSPYMFAYFYSGTVYLVTAKGGNISLESYAINYPMKSLSFDLADKLLNLRSIGKGPWGEHYSFFVYLDTDSITKCYEMSKIVNIGSRSVVFSPDNRFAFVNPNPSFNGREKVSSIISCINRVNGDVDLHNISFEPVTPNVDTWGDDSYFYDNIAYLFNACFLDGNKFIHITCDGAVYRYELDLSEGNPCVVNGARLTDRGIVGSFYCSNDGSNVYWCDSNSVYNISLEYDSKELIGVRYKNRNFYLS